VSSPRSRSPRTLSLVEEKPLKSAVAGTPLTFSLYSDSTCSALLQSVPVNVEDVTILVRLKQMTPKNDAKLPNTVELRHTLSGVSPSATTYLQVTGDGIVALPNTCQAQTASSVSAPPVAAPAVPVLTDFVGAVVGTLQVDGCGPTVIARTPSGKAAAVPVAAAGFLSGCHSQIYFPSQNCTGTPYLKPAQMVDNFPSNVITPSEGVNGTVYVPAYSLSPPVPPQASMLYSAVATACAGPWKKLVPPLGCCETLAPQYIGVAPAAEIMTFAPPFSVTQ
jgi:hypothetical protein